MTKKNDFFNPYKKNKEKKVVPKNFSKEKDRILLSWKIQDIEKLNKGKRFYVILYAILFAITVYGLITNNLLLSVLVILMGFAFFLFEKQEPRLITFAITEKGIFIHDHLYSYQSLKSFWIENQPDNPKELSFRTSQIFLPYLKVPLKEKNPADIRKILLNFLPEEEHHQSWTDFLDKI